MKIKYAVLGILCFLILTCSTGDDVREKMSGSDGVLFQKLTLAEAMERARTQDKLVMVDFFSPT